MEHFSLLSYCKNLLARIGEGVHKVGARKHARPAILALGVLLAITVVAIPHDAHAWDLFGIGDIAGSAIGWIGFVVFYIVGLVAGFAISVATYFIEVLLAINTTIPNSALVKQGFQISLAVTNLFFVLGIIVIAIATIIRSQTYGMKQILWKLVVMAILVNFGLVLVAPIISFSDQVTTYFIDAFAPSGPPVPGLSSKYHAFATSLAGAFGPQRIFVSGNTSDDGITVNNVAGAVGNGLGSVVAQILNLVFPVIFLIFIGITLGVFVVMLFIRYVYLSYLLVLLPFAWLAWVFPTFKQHFEKWWHHFIRWTFFAPIVMFFLYLAIITARAMSGTGPDNPLFAVNSPEFQSDNLILGGIQSLIGGFMGKIITTLVQMATLLAITIGGLMIANSMGITFADAGVKAATSVSKGLGSYVGRRTKQYGGATMREGGRGKAAAESIQRWAGNRTSRLGKFGAGLINQGATRLSTLASEDTVKREEAGVAAIKNTRDLQAALATAPEPKRVAILNELAKRDAMDGVDAKISHGENGETKQSFTKYQQGKAYNEVEKKSGFSSDMYKNRGDQVALRKVAEEFAKTLGKSGIGKVPLDDLYSGKDGKFGFTPDELKNMSDAFTHGIATAAPELVPTMMSKMKSASLGRFADSYDRELDQEGLRILRDFTPGSPEATTALRRLAEKQTKFNQSMANNAMGLFVETPVAGATPTPPPTTPPPATP